MKNQILLILLLVFGLSASHAQTSKSTQGLVEKLYITTLGAIGDGVTNNQSVVQHSIDELSGKGGGVLYFPTEKWLVGDVSLRDFVTLQFEGGCTLKGNITIQDVRNVGIIGEESDWLVIDDSRVIFSNSQNLVLKNIINSRGWRISNCQGVIIDRVKLETPLVRQPNGQGGGITCGGCKDVYVTNAQLTCNDDSWCLKRSGENIHISKNIICGRQAASVKIGTESDGVFKNITVTDCIIYNSTRASINLEAVDGSLIQDVIISNVRMIDVAAPLYIQLGNRDRYNSGTGNIRNITISDVEYWGTFNDDGIGSSIIGLPGRPVENVTISRVHFNYKGGGTKIDAARTVPELPEYYPEFDIYGKFPAYGFYCRHVSGLVLDDVTVSFSEADLRPAIICEDVQHLAINRLKAKTYIAHNQYSPPFEECEPQIILNQVSDASILYCQAPIFSSLVKLQGAQTKDISLIKVLFYNIVDNCLK
jgi:polygalacturonase